MLEPIAGPLVGRSLPDLTESHNSGGMQLLTTGRITAYEATHILKKTAARYRFWVSALPDKGSTGSALVVLQKEQAQRCVVVRQPASDSIRPIIGTTDARLIIDRVTDEVGSSLGYPVDDIVGRSLLGLVATDDVGSVLAALAETSRNGDAVSRRIAVVDAGGGAVPCQLVLLPLVPAPSCAFALLTEPAGRAEVDGRAVAEMILQLGRSVRAGVTSPARPDAVLRPDVDLGRLTSREQEIIYHLLAGDRVPAIAKRLYLSEGTVRNNLSSAFAKFGVKNQRQLIEHLRAAPGQPRT